MTHTTLGYNSSFTYSTRVVDTATQYDDLEASTATVVVPALTNDTDEETYHLLGSLGAVPMTVIYGVISVVGVVGNTLTCFVIARNKRMHTATDYYLFNISVSDILLLLTGMPHEMLILWRPVPYAFGSEFCFFRGLMSETSTNASILTITAFTIERYIGICHPLKSHAMVRLSRVVKYIGLIWVVACLSAMPQAIQYGIVYAPLPNGTVDLEAAECSIKHKIEEAFQVSTFLFFIVPMSLITIVYLKIGHELKRSAMLSKSVSVNTAASIATDRRRTRGVVKMLVAVVVAFFICFAPHHAQRLLAVYGDETNEVHRQVYIFLTHSSGTFFYLSTCINPVLYHVMSKRFREALKATMKSCFSRRDSSSGNHCGESEPLGRERSSAVALRIRSYSFTARNQALVQRGEEQEEGLGRAGVKRMSSAHVLRDKNVVSLRLPAKSSQKDLFVP